MRGWQKERKDPSPSLRENFSSEVELGEEAVDGLCPPCNAGGRGRAQHAGVGKGGGGEQEHGRPGLSHQPGNALLEMPLQGCIISQMTEHPSIVFTGKIDTTLVFVGLSVGDSIVNCFMYINSP